MLCQLQRLVRPLWDRRLRGPWYAQRSSHMLATGKAPDESRMDTAPEYSVLSRGPVLPFRPLPRTRHRGLAGPVRTAVTRVSGTLEEM